MHGAGGAAVLHQCTHVWEGVLATIEQLMARIEKRMFVASGLSVQLHMEDGLLEMLRSGYNLLFDDFWTPEYSLSRVETLDGTTGQVTNNLSNVIRRYKDVHSVIPYGCTVPLSKLPAGTDISDISERCITPSADPQKVFKVLPADTTGTVTIWYRTRIADSVWDDVVTSTEVNMDDEVLILYVVAELLDSDDSNARAADRYKKSFEARQQQLRDAQWLGGLAKTPVEFDSIPTRWR